MEKAKKTRNRRNTIPYGISSLNLTLGRRITDEEINEIINEAGREIADGSKSNKDSELLLSLLGSAKGIREEFERSKKEDESYD